MPKRLVTLPVGGEDGEVGFGQAQGAVLTQCPIQRVGVDPIRWIEQLREQILRCVRGWHRPIVQGDGVRVGLSARNLNNIVRQYY